MKYDIILLDADGTLYDFDASEANALVNTLSWAGMPTDRKTVSLYHEINDREWKALERGETTRERLRTERFEKLLSALLPLGCETDKTATDIADRYVEELSHQCILFPESEEVCRTLSEKCSLYIITNGTAWVQKSRFAPSPVTKYIKKTYISEEVGYTKPAREYFDAVLSDIGIVSEEARDRVLVVGDSPSSDITGGINAGLDTCLYDPSGKGSGGVMPTYTIRSLYDLYEICLSEKTN